MAHDHNTIDEQKYIEEYARICTIYCSLLEHTLEFDKPDFVIKIREILALLYYKTISLPIHECGFDGSAPSYVTEEDYSRIQGIVKKRLGGNDEYLEVFDPRVNEADGPVVRLISEDLADIYQDTKNFSLNFGLGNPETTHDAIHECLANFDNYWGRCAVNVLRALHSFCSGEEELIDDAVEAEKKDSKGPDTQNWLINQFFNDK